MLILEYINLIGPVRNSVFILDVGVLIMLLFWSRKIDYIGFHF